MKEKQYYDATQDCMFSYIELNEIEVMVTGVEIYESFNGNLILDEINERPVVNICTNAFKNCHSLEIVSASDVVEIDSGAFENCVNLKDVNLPRVEKLGFEVFKGCNNLKNVYTPKLENEKAKYERFGKNEKIENINNLIKDYVNIDSNEIEKVIENLDDNTINKLQEIGEKIVDYKFKQSIIKGLDGAEDLENQKFIENTINEIEDTEKDLKILEEKSFDKEKYAEIYKLIIESIKSMLLELARDFKIELQILKEKFANKNKEELNNNTEEIESELNLNLTLNDKIKMASIKELPKNILVALSKEEDIKVLRKLAINENLPKEVFYNLAKNKDLKLKELLLENENISIEALNILIDDKDEFIKTEAIKHKNIDIKVLNDLYEKNIKNDKILSCIVKNENCPRELLEKICDNSKVSDEIKAVAIKNKNHPSNNIFKEPEISTDKSNELYQKLVLKTDIRKNDLLEMFRNKEIYADEKGNAIFPIKDNDNKIIGAYSLNIDNNEKPLLLDGSYAKNNDLEKSKNLANKIYETFKEEIVEEIEEMEME